jgi:hypothetical protein
MAKFRLQGKVSPEKLSPKIVARQIVAAKNCRRHKNVAIHKKPKDQKIQKLFPTYLLQAYFGG